MDPDQLTRKGRETRLRIVTVAADLIDRQGVAGTTIEDVRSAAEVSASQLYHYFADKRDLVRAVIDHQAEIIVGAQPEPDSFAALDAWRDAIVDLQRRRSCAGGCPLGSLSVELSEGDTSARGALAAAFGRWEEVLRRGLTAMRDRGELRPEADPDRLALATLAALQGGLLLTQARRDTTALEAALDAMLERIRAEVAVPGPRRVQLRRATGWRKPSGTVVVARPSRWGNPYRLGPDSDRSTVVERFRTALHAGELAFTVADVRAQLAGRDLACWCPPGEACHADVLLDVANPARAG